MHQSQMKQKSVKKKFSGYRFSSPTSFGTTGLVSSSFSQIEGNTPMKENFFAKSLSELCIKVLAWRSESSKKAFRKCFISSFKHTLLKNDSFDFVNRGLNQIFYSSGGGCDLEIVQLVPSRRICAVRKHTNMLLILIFLDFWPNKHPQIEAWFQQSTSLSKTLK